MYVVLDACMTSQAVYMSVIKELKVWFLEMIEICFAVCFRRSLVTCILRRMSQLQQHILILDLVDTFSIFCTL